MAQLRRMVSAAGVALWLALQGPPGALAHEERTIDGGKYRVAVGWDVEPVLEQQKNAATIRVLRLDTGRLLEGLENTLAVEIRQGQAARTFPLRGVPGQPGAYAADVIPTSAGEYSFTFVGSIEGDQVAETFDSRQGKLEGVSMADDLHFPGPAIDTEQMAYAVKDLKSQAFLDEREAQLTRAMALSGMGLGVLGVISALVALCMRASTPPHRETASPRDPSASRTVENAGPVHEAGEA